MNSAVPTEQICEIRIDHLSHLDIPPDTFLDEAERAGYISAGLRGNAFIRPPEQSYALTPKSDNLAACEKRLKQVQIRNPRFHVHMLEIAGLEADTDLSTLTWMFDAAKTLGAKNVLVAPRDANLDRAREKFLAFAELARQREIQLLIEPMSYAPVNSVAKAKALIKGTDSRIILDALQLARITTEDPANATLDDAAMLRAIQETYITAAQETGELLGYVQLCDGPLRLQDSYPDVKLPRNMSTGGGPAALEGRGFRWWLGVGDQPYQYLVAAVPPNTPMAYEIPNYWADFHYRGHEPEMLRVEYAMMVQAVQAGEALRPGLAPTRSTSGITQSLGPK